MPRQQLNAMEMTHRVAAQIADKITPQTALASSNIKIDPFA